MGLRSWVKKTKKKADKAIDHAGEVLEDTAKDVGKVGVRAGKEINKTAENTMELTQEFFEQTVKEFTMSVIDDAKKDIRDFAKGAVQDVKKEVLDEVRRGGETALNTAKAGIITATHEAEIVFTERLPDLLKQALESLEKAVGKEGLKITRRAIAESHKEMGKLREWDAELARYIDAQSIEVEIGPITLSYGAFYLRAEKLVDALDRYINQPPAFRRTELLELIEAMGPDTVDLGIKVSAALFVVSSSSVGVGYRMPKMPMKLFTHLGDKALAALGVPE